MNRVFCGAALFCIYSRARWSDFVHGSCIRLDVLETDGRVAYADMEVQIHKTMRASSKRFKFLDLVASGQGICGSDWIKQWIHALSCIGVDPLVHSPGKSLMPAPADDGTALQRSLESDEASTWLRLLLGESSSRLQSNRLISSHSLKATILSMAAKRGLKHEDRLAMGHHAHPFKMADTYARDAQARVIRLVDKLLLEIQSGYFNPDCSRAGRFNKQCMPDPSSDVGAQSFNDSDGENFSWKKRLTRSCRMLWKWLRRKLQRLMRIIIRVPLLTVKLKALCLRSQSGSSCPHEHRKGTISCSTGGQKPCTWWMPNFLVELAVVDCWTRTLSCPHN